jgi:hypothetical protein
VRLTCRPAHDNGRDSPLVTAARGHPSGARVPLRRAAVSRLPSQPTRNDVHAHICNERIPITIHRQYSHVWVPPNVGG